MLILLVEDELVVAIGVRRMLESAGHRVCGVAATAEAALRMAREQKPDLVLMDVTLKGQRDGIDAAADILAQQPAGIIFVTAHSDQATCERMAVLQPISILQKPFTERQLIQVVGEAISGKRQNG